MMHGWSCALKAVVALTSGSRVEYHDEISKSRYSLNAS